MEENVQQKQRPKVSLKIYTRTGDKGKTSLYGGKRVAKYSSRIEAIGSVDELNSAIGVAVAAISDKLKAIRKELVKIQNDLFDIGSQLASSSDKQQPIRNKNLEQRAKEFEDFIDEITKKLPQLHNFILPGGGKGGSQLHFARTVARRAERRIVELSKKEAVDSSILQYCNRLSDLLFTMARFVNYKENKKEVIWKT